MSEFDASWPNTQSQTIWPNVEIGCGEDDAARRARKNLLIRYHEVVQRYFRDQIRDPHAADELYSNFALKLLESNRLIRGADPERGRFRHYIKAALRNMVYDYYRTKVRQHPGSLPVETPQPTRPDPFLSVTQEVLLNKVWASLKEYDDRTGERHSPVLRHHSDNPGMRSAEHAAQLTAEWGKPISADNFRQMLRRARVKFAVLLLEEIQRWAESSTKDELEAAVNELQLGIYCEDALAKWRSAVT